MSPRAQSLAAALAAVLVALWMWGGPTGPRIGGLPAPSDDAAATARAVQDTLVFDEAEHPSAIALYDLGWAWLARGEPERALAALRAAGRLRPRSPDIAHNLAVARNALDDDIPAPVAESPTWTAVVTPGEAGILAVLAWLGTTALLLAARRGASPALPLAAAVTAVGLSATAMSGRAAHLGHPVAVAVDDTVARDGPALDAGERHVLPPGTEVRIEVDRGPFLLVVDGKDRRGWVLRESVVWY